MKKPVNLKKAGKNLLCFLAYFFITLASGNYLPVSLALLTANLYIGFNPLSACILCFIPYLFSFSTPVILSAVWGSVFLGVVFYAFKRYGKKPKLLILYVFVAVAPYMIFTDYYSLEFKIAFTAVILPLCYVFIHATKVWTIKGLKYKLSRDEIIASSGLFCLVGYGVISVFGTTAWKEFSIFTVLFSTAIAPYGYGAFVAFSSAIPIAVSSGTLLPIAVFGVYFVVASLFSSYSKLLSGILVIGTELLLYYFTSVLSPFSETEVLCILIPCCTFIFIPEVVFKKCRSALKVYTVASIGRYAVNRNRAVISAKLYDVSAVFDEMAECVKKLGKKSESKEDKISKISEETEAQTCYNCKKFSKCNLSNVSMDIEKAVNLGIAKGKVNLVDLPKNISDNCIRLENLVENINYCIKNSEKKDEETAVRNGGIDILQFQATGLSEALKGLALSFSKNSEFDSDKEVKIRDELIKCGIYPHEILVYEDDGDDIDLVVPSSAPEKSYFLKAISEAVGYRTVIVGRTNLSSSLSAITVKKAPSYDATFGISQKTKDGESYSGDTHSIMKISESKFLVALNDGMGSGENAMNTSSIATSLIETFYKSGLPSKIILSIVNKLLAFDKEDNFTAMDIGIVDLSDGSADFIKIGSPYSFVITKDSVKIIEGNSLPLGILDEIKPTVCKTTLFSGDMIVFISDGVADAFGSASEVIEFLSTQRALNPKTLAEDIISKATILSFGKASDDMTAFCIRIFN